MRLIAEFLITPLHQFLLLAILAGFSQYRGWLGWSRFWWIMLILWIFLLAFSPLPTWLVHRWERQHPALLNPPALQAPTTIIVLGGGHTPDAQLPVNDQLSRRALGRVVEGVRLYRQIPGSRLVGTGYTDEGGMPQGELLMQTAVALGVPTTDTLQIVQPHDTEAEARACAQKFSPGTSIILVTDAIHMPRALYWFRRAGLDPHPAPTNHYVRNSPQHVTYHFFPELGKLEMTRALFHEWAGLLYARLKESSG